MIPTSGLPDKVAKAWGRCTTAPFFSTHVEGLEACENNFNGKPAVFVANHQSWLDIYASFWLDWDRALKDRVEGIYFPHSSMWLGHVADRARAV